MGKILIIEDDLVLCRVLRNWLERKRMQVECASTTAQARKIIATTDADIILSDMRLPDGDGIGILEWMNENRYRIPFVIMTQHAEVLSAVRAMKLGAEDYLPKPFQPETLYTMLNGLLRRKEAAKERNRLIFRRESKQSREVERRAVLVGSTDMSVLVRGENGTGKEHVAITIHKASSRASAPFVSVDCGSISKELAASEFFGHVKGAFTGALADKTGAFEAADGGTLFLDEVGNLTYETQVQLLRALQERRIRPVGSNREIPVDIRLVAATNEDLEAAIARGTFRADLYHRINSFTLRMPCLRQMREDIPLYADFFLDQANRELDKRIVGFDPAAAAALAAYDWPGNLRQLRNTVLSATLLAAGEYITCRDLPAEVTGGPAEPAEAPLSLRDPASEEEQIRRALATAGGNKSQAAKLLGIDRKTLYNKLHLYGIE